MEMTNFQPEARDVAKFGKSPCQIAFILPKRLKYLFKIDKNCIFG